MLYALLIHQAEEAIEERSATEEEAALAAHRALQQKAKEAGTFVEANQLMPSAAATSVRVRGGETELMDGPFAESKEVFIGYYVLDCENLDEAIDYARMIPVSDMGGVEVRPVAYFEGPGQSGGE